MQLYPWAKHIKSLLSECRNKSTLIKIHSLTIVTGYFNQGKFNSQLIACYAKVGEVVLARQLFDKLPRRDLDACNAMIAAYSRMGFPGEVIALYNKMILEGIRPDSSSFTVAIKACTRLLDLKRGEEIWHQAVYYGYEYDVFVECSVLNVYAKCGKMDKAKAAFDRTARKDVVCWATMITGFAQCGRAEGAVEIYREMQKHGVEADGVVILGLIQACTDLGNKNIGLSVHGHMIRKSLPFDVVVCTSLVDMYAKNGLLELACRVFSRIPQKNGITWSTLLSGFAQNGFAVEALGLFREMQKDGYRLDLTPLVSALSACSQLGYLKMGRSVHGYILRRQDLERVSATAVIDLYSKCGALVSARVIFDRISSKDLICWNTMIASYGIHGHGKEALSLFMGLIATDLKPDDATFAALLSALSHSGLVEEGRYWFDQMIGKFKVQPREKHYAYVVDLLARAGRVQGAHDIINSIIHEPTIPIWVALLSGCYNHGKFVTGETAAIKILELKPNDSGIYSLVANFFAAAKKWDQVLKVRKLMRMTGLKKVPGYSMIEVKGKHYSFLMEDTNKPQYKQMIKIIEKLDHEMRSMGYVPKTELVLHDVEEEVKVRMLSRHVRDLLLLLVS